MNRRMRKAHEAMLRAFDMNDDKTFIIHSKRAKLLKTNQLIRQIRFVEAGGIVYGAHFAR